MKTLKQKIVMNWSSIGFIHRFIDTDKCIFDCFISLAHLLVSAVLRIEFPFEFAHNLNALCNKFIIFFSILVSWIMWVWLMKIKVKLRIIAYIFDLWYGRYMSRHYCSNGFGLCVRIECYKQALTHTLVNKRIWYIKMQLP